MTYENGEWMIRGLPDNSPERIKTFPELEVCVEKLGFLPLFSNEIEGFSVEERTSASSWWTGDPDSDPWEWREIVARRGKVAYGKFFGNKAGFISTEWLPYFVNYRRDGYDFESLCDEGLALRRERKIMELFDDHDELYSFEIKKLAGFGKDGEKNFNGVITDLQMKTYLVTRDFRRRINKKGQEYGMSVAVYTTPETIFGSELVSSAYGEEPSESMHKISDRVRELFPEADEKAIKKLCL